MRSSRRPLPFPTRGDNSLERVNQWLYEGHATIVLSTPSRESTLRLTETSLENLRPRH